MRAYFFIVATLCAGINHAGPPAQKDVTVTLFQWSFDSVARECSEYLGPKGFGYVQISPPQEHIDGPQWWTSYQPISYEIKGKLGDKEAFIRMIKACHDAKVKVIADIVINHMASCDAKTNKKYQYYGLYDLQDFHTCYMSIGDDYNSRSKVQNCELVGLADLDTSSDRVQNRIVEYLKNLIELGIDGFRIDAAKHIAAVELSQIQKKLNDDSIFWVSEVIHGDNEAVQPEEYLGIGDVDEFRFGRDLKRMFLYEKLHHLRTFGTPWGFLASSHARSFIDNWDTERNGSTLSYKNGAAYTLANVFMLASSYGAPNIFSGYEFIDKDQGPPNNGKVKECFADGFKCQHRWRQIANMVAWRNAANYQAITNWWSNQQNAIAFSRGRRTFIAINHENFGITERFQTSLPKGNFCDVQHGDITEQGCTGPSYKIDQDGSFTAFIGAHDAIALYLDD